MRIAPSAGEKEIYMLYVYKQCPNGGIASSGFTWLYG